MFNVNEEAPDQSRFCNYTTGMTKSCARMGTLQKQCVQRQMDEVISVKPGRIRQNTFTLKTELSCNGMAMADFANTKLS